MFSRIATPLRPERERLIRSLFEDYIEMYASRDERLTARFSTNFSGYAGSSDILVTDRDEWIRITRLDSRKCPNVSASKCWLFRCRIWPTTWSP